MKLKQLIAENKKVLSEVHSGNLNPIMLPTKLPSYTFLRIPAHPDMGTYPKV
jgi:putative protease